ncbi:hypothetical protein [Phormidesmis sp. 146-33]
MQTALRNFPFSDRTRKQLKKIQDRLSLTNADAESIKVQLLPKASPMTTEAIALPQPVQKEPTKAAHVQNLQYQKLEEYLSNG